MRWTGGLCGNKILKEDEKSEGPAAFTDKHLEVVALKVGRRHDISAACGVNMENQWPLKSNISNKLSNLLNLSWSALTSALTQLWSLLPVVSCYHNHKVVVFTFGD